jgi:hypothetical protein
MPRAKSQQWRGFGVGPQIQQFASGPLILRRDANVEIGPSGGSV